MSYDGGCGDDNCGLCATDALIAKKDAEIAALQKRIAELEACQWRPIAEMKEQGNG